MRSFFLPPTIQLIPHEVFGDTVGYDLLDAVTLNIEQELDQYPGFVVNPPPAVVENPVATVDKDSDAIFKRCQAVGSSRLDVGNILGEAFLFPMREFAPNVSTNRPYEVQVSDLVRNYMSSTTFSNTVPGESRAFPGKFRDSMSIDERVVEYRQSKALYLWGDC